MCITALLVYNVIVIVQVGDAVSKVSDIIVLVVSVLLQLIVQGCTIFILYHLRLKFNETNSTDSHNTKLIDSNTDDSVVVIGNVL